MGVLVVPSHCLAPRLVVGEEVVKATKVTARRTVGLDTVCAKRDR